MCELINTRIYFTEPIPERKLNIILLFIYFLTLATLLRIRPVLYRNSYTQTARSETTTYYLAFSLQKKTSFTNFLMNSFISSLTDIHNYQRQAGRTTHKDKETSTDLL